MKIIHSKEQAFYQHFFAHRICEFAMNNFRHFMLFAKYPIEIFSI